MPCKPLRELPCNEPNSALPGLTVRFPGVLATQRGAPLTVAVSYRYACRVPFVRSFMCSDGALEISAESTLAIQTADYTPGAW